MHGRGVFPEACTTSSGLNAAVQPLPGFPLGFCSHSGAARSAAQNEVDHILDLAATPRAAVDAHTST
jgi:hypothetical protein